MLVLVAAAAVLVWLAAAVVTAFDALGDVRAARTDLTSARAQADAASVAEGRPLRPIRRAHQRLEDASSDLRSPLFLPVRGLPVVGRQLRSADALTRAARQVTDAAIHGLTGARDVLSGPKPTGPGRVDVARRVADLAEGTQDRLEGLDLGPRVGLVPPLARAYNQLADEVDELRQTLARTRTGASALAGLLQGPSRYLFFAANNAEMRAGAGMLLSVGELAFADGSITLGDMRSVTDVTVPPGTVPLTGDYADRWGWLEPNVEWRNLMVSPRFDVNAPLAAAMWQAAGHEPVDGVLVLDPVALAAVMEATGPVEVEGRSYEPATVVDELLHDQYTRFGAEEVQERRDELGRVAEALFPALEEGQGTLATLSDSLARAVGGRHLMVWSNHAGLQEAWHDLGVAGALREDSLMLSVLNRGANKLDRYLRVSAAMAVGEGPEEGAEVTVEVSLTNTVPEGEHPYIAGPAPGVDADEGQYVGLLAVQLPGAARNGRILSFDQLAVAGADGPTRVVAAPFNLRRGQVNNFTLRFELPGRTGSIRVEASARVPPTQWSYGPARWTDGARRDVVWRAPEGR